MARSDGAPGTEAVWQDGSHIGDTWSGAVAGTPGRFEMGGAVYLGVGGRCDSFSDRAHLLGFLALLRLQKTITLWALH